MKTQGDSLFDIVDKRDHGTVQAQLLHGVSSNDGRQSRSTSFFCRMNMSRTLKRQGGFGDVKVIGGQILEQEKLNLKRLALTSSTHINYAQIYEALIKDTHAYINNLRIQGAHTYAAIIASAASFTLSKRVKKRLEPELKAVFKFVRELLSKRIPWEETRYSTYRTIETHLKNERKSRFCFGCLKRSWNSA